MRTPPANIDAEVQVLGSMILDAKATPLALNVLNSGDFFRPGHQVLYQAVVDLFYGNMPIEVVSIKNRLVSLNKLDYCGGIDYLVSLAESIPSASNVEYYAKIVRDCAIKREMISAANKVLMEAYDRAATPCDLARGIGDIAYTAMKRLADTSGVEMSLGRAAANVVDDIRKSIAGGQPIVKSFATGYQQIDDHINGIRPGEVITIAADTSRGKSLWATGVSCNVAEQGGKVLYISNEMPPYQLAARALQAYGSVWGQKITRMTADAEELGRLESAEQKIKDFGIHIVGKSCSPVEILAKVKEMSAKWASKIDLVVIDYLQMMTPSSKGMTALESINDAMKHYKDMAIAMDLCVMVVSQINRPADQHYIPPELYRLKESSTIEQASDSVVLLHVPEFHSPRRWITTGGEEYFEAWCKIAKARAGLVSDWPREGDEESAIRLSYQGWFTRIKSWMGGVPVNKI